MASTTGLVQRVCRSSGGNEAGVLIGPAVAASEVFVLAMASTDPPNTAAFKRSILHLLTEAHLAGYPVVVNHDANSATITSAATVPFDISPIGSAIHGDFYSVSGAGIPNDAVLVFESSTVMVVVTPDLIRPHMVFVAELPSSIPVGRGSVRVQSSTWTSDTVPIDVSSGPRATVRVLYSGDPKPSPYSIVFVGNPAITLQNGTAPYTDPVLMNRSGYASGVSYCLDNILLSTEDVLRQSNQDAHIRLASVFDATRGPSDASALAKEYAPNIIETRRDKLNAFLSGYSQTPDIVFVMTDSTTFNRASAWFTSDDPKRPGTAYTHDGTARTHGHFALIPGSTAVPISATGLTAFHEFGHASSDFVNGMVSDLYVDGASGYNVNKKARASSTVAVPSAFATYQGTVFNSDATRDSLGYPNNWTSYHPQLIDATRPNAMDNYWLATNPPDPRTCRLDQLTYVWLSDRLRAKISR